MAELKTLNAPKANRTPKEDLIQMLLDMGALKFKTKEEGDFSLKLKSRQSPYFLSMREVDDGKGMLKLGSTYNASMQGALSKGDRIDAIYGPPEAGISIVTAADYMSELEGRRVPSFYTRKVPKGGAKKEPIDQKKLADLPKLTPDEIKGIVLGRQPKESQKVLLIDDRKVVDEPPYEAISLARRMGLEPAAIMMQNPTQGGLKPEDVANATGITVIGVTKAGESPLKTGESYTSAIMNAELVSDSTATPSFDLVMGASSEGIAAAVATAMTLERLYSINMPWFFTRVVVKDYGEASGTGSSSVQGSIAAEEEELAVYGHQPKWGDHIPIVDDMMTVGLVKDEAKAMLEKRFQAIVSGMFLTADRQEVNVFGFNAAEDWGKKNNIPVYVQIGSTDIHAYLKETSFVNVEGLSRKETYLRVYGTKSARDYIGGIQPRLSDATRGIIPACDVETLEEFADLVRQTAPVDGVMAMKIGFSLGLEYGLPEVVKAARMNTPEGAKTVVIYDHQKAATDIPDTSAMFMKVLKTAGVDAVILFPQSGPEVERAWIYRAFEAGLTAIVGGWMTHPAYAQQEGGFLTKEGILDIYRIAARAGVVHFVVPATKPAAIAEIDAVIRAEGIDHPVYMSPGIGAQGGTPADIKNALGGQEFSLYGIVGRAILKAPDKHEAAIKEVAELRR